MTLKNALGDIALDETLKNGSQATKLVDANGDEAAITDGELAVADAAAEAALTSIDTKTPALVSGRVPVDIGSASVTITGPVTVSNEVEVKNDEGSPIPISDAGGSITVDGTVGISGTVPVSGPLTDTQLRASAVPVSAASLPLPSGAATSANQSTANASLASIDGKLPNQVGGRIPVDGSGVTQPVSGSVTVSGTVTATGPLTDTQLRASAVPISANALPLPTGAATAANQTTANSSLSSIDGKLPALNSGNVPVLPAVQLGSGVMTATTQRVTLATDGPTVTNLTSIDTKTPALVSGRVPVDGSAVIQPVSGTLTAVGAQVLTSATFTRPANTTAYTAQSVVSDSTSTPTVLTFSGAARVNAGTGMILSARHVKSSTTTTGATYRLYLYTTAPTAINDGSQFPLLWANRSTRLGHIDFSHSTGGTGSDSSSGLTTFANLPFVCAGGSTTLYGILVVTSAYTPTSGEQHYIELEVAQN